MAAELEVAAVLLKLRRHVWVAPAAQGLRWGARRRRSAGSDEVRRPMKKRRRAARALEGTGSPQTPLDFSPSGDETEVDRKPVKVASWNCGRRELEKEAEEVKNRLDAFREQSSMLTALQLKFDSPEQESCMMSEEASQTMPPQVTTQIVQQAWGGQWLNGGIILRGGAQWSWMASLNWPDTLRPCNLPDLSAPAADKDPLEQFLIQKLPQQLQQQQQLHQKRRGSLEEQRAARKKRIEMMHLRRRISALR